MKKSFAQISRWILAIIVLSLAVACHNKDELVPSSPLDDYWFDLEIKCKVVDYQTGETVNGVQLIPGLDINGKFTPYPIFALEKFKNLDTTDVIIGGSYIIKEKNIDYGGNREILLKLHDPKPESDGHYESDIYRVRLKYLGPPQEGAPEYHHGKWGAEITFRADCII